MRRLALSICLAVSGAVGQSAADKLVPEAEKATTLEKNLRVLTDEIGGRVPGTPAMERAVQWGVDAFKAAGADRVHTEDVRLASSWTEGNTQVDVVSPSEFHVRAVSLTWTEPSWSPAQGRRVVDVGFGTEQDFKKAGDLKGAIADAPDRLGPRQNRAEIEALIRETHLDDQLKGFDMWPDWESGKRGRFK